MNILKNKYFLLGNLAFILLLIPVTLFIVKKQTSTRSNAAPTTTLAFNPPNVPVEVCKTVNTNLIINPGQNEVSTVEISLTWDPSLFTLEFSPNSQAFPQVLKGPTISNGTMKVTLNIGANVTKAITAATTVGTVTIKPLNTTNGTPTKLNFDTAGTKVYSLSTQDGATENVFNSAGSNPLGIAVTPCSSGTVSPTPTGVIANSATPTPTNAPAALNQPPACINLQASVSSGAAPLTVTFTANGNDPDGTISKATFTFGDGAVQDVTSNMGTATVSAQANHTFTTGGNFVAHATFTDNNGAISNSNAANSCASPQLNITGGVSPTPTIAPTSTPVPTNPPATLAPIAKPGGVGATFGVIGGIIFAIGAGVLLLVL